MPVPSPVFGPLLEQIDDLAELKCTLRVIWLLHQRRGFPRIVTLGDLRADRTLDRALAQQGSMRPRLEDVLARAVERGTLVMGSVRRGDAEEPAYALNIEADRRALEAIGAVGLSANDGAPAEPAYAASERPNIFALYEDSIGMLSPIIADELREAESLYPPTWVEEAFREAVAQNKRSWRYVARILERWEREGRGDGEPGRHPKKAGYY